MSWGNRLSAISLRTGVWVGGFFAGLLLVPGTIVQAVQHYDHVLVLSIDGLHEADLASPALAAYLPNILAFQQSAVTFDNAHTVSPSDSFPTSLSYFTGAKPSTAGVYYDDTFNRALYSPGSSPASEAGTEVAWSEVIDKNKNTLGAGGAADASSINTGLLPQRLVNGVLQPVMPHDILKVNTVFEVAHNAGLQTAYIEKHPSYEIYNGPSGQGLSDFYAPESNAKVAISNGTLVDANNGTRVTKSLPLSEAYDDLRLKALLNQIHGQDSRGLGSPGTPAIYGMNLIALNTAQKDPSPAGGIEIDPITNQEIVGADLATALQHTDANFGQIINALKSTGQFNSTLVVLTAHGGNSPRIGSAYNIAPGALTTPLINSGIGVKFANQDDSVLVWLTDHSQAALAASIIPTIDPQHVESVLFGNSLMAAGFGNPLTDERAPDLVINLTPDALVGSGKRAEHGGSHEDDTHVALLVGSGGLADNLKGSISDEFVMQQQIAVTTLEALGLDPNLLQGAMLDGTTALPMSVPEPSSLVLLVAGAALLAIRRWRRRYRLR